MANWCVNYITFTGEKENIAKLEQEVDHLIKVYDSHNGQLPKGFDQATSSSDYIFDLEKCDGDDKTLIILYKSKWDVSTDVLLFISNKYKVEFKGTCIEEQNRTDTCAFVVGTLDYNNEFVVIKKTLSECGLDVDYMVEEQSYFTEEFLEDTAMTLANNIASLYKGAIEDAQFQNGDMTE